ncbi:hypothetical protein L1987_55105 [Smallanthus sonchifolius]|uniref:Uncharacterized protein n=1 Tax=Smallanthus sonchifolius TaxID=185202 RepID=A0ACB9E8P9_9ASTR|nr:hypothetical protein L1987_55105 [Smallanthus sonchifolius]
MNTGLACCGKTSCKMKILYTLDAVIKNFGCISGIMMARESELPRHHVSCIESIPISATLVTGQGDGRYDSGRRERRRHRRVPATPNEEVFVENNFDLGAVDTRGVDEGKDPRVAAVTE